MKCNNCGILMEIYKRSTRLHFTEIRWRCSVCGYEDVEQESWKLPKPIKEETKPIKEDKK